MNNTLFYLSFAGALLSMYGAGYCRGMANGYIRCIKERSAYYVTVGGDEPQEAAIRDEEQ